MITLHPLARSDAGKVAHLVLPETQTSFVGTVDEMANDPDPQIRLHFAAHQDQVIGFFKTDLDLSRRIKELAPNTLGLRGLLIGGQYQGRGFGTALLAALPHYLRRTHPEASAIWLSVDAGNKHAIRCYEKAGWVKAGRPRAGRCGPEHVMRLQLDTTVDQV